MSPKEKAAPGRSGLRVGCETIARDEDLVFTWLSLAAGQINEAGLADWLRPRLVYETTETSVTSAP